MNFTQWRNLHKISQEQFAKLAKVAYTSILKYEKGGNLRQATIDKIEKAINDLDGGLFISQKKDYSPKSILIDDLWKYIPKEFNYIAKDKHGDIYLFKSKPEINLQSGEYLSDNGCARLPLNVQFDDLDWKECIEKRPYNYWEYIGKVGIFSDSSNPNINIIGKLESINLDCDSPFKKENGFSYNNFRPLTELEKSELA